MKTPKQIAEQFARCSSSEITTLATAYLSYEEKVEKIKALKEDCGITFDSARAVYDKAIDDVLEILA